MPGFGKRGQTPAGPRSWAEVPLAMERRDSILDDRGEPPAPVVKLLAGLTAACMFGLVAGAAVMLVVNGLPWGSFTAAAGVQGGADGYVSPLDATCRTGWTAGLPNGKQLQCYLTTHIERLCQPEERRHLVQVMTQYSTDTGPFERAFLAASLGMALKAQTEGYKLGYLSAKVSGERDAPHPDEKQMAEDWQEISSTAADLNRGPDEVMRRAKDLVPQYQLINEVKALMLKDLIAREDFGWAGHPLVNRAEREIRKEQLVVKPLCLRLPKA